MNDREIEMSVLSTEYLVLRLAGLTLNESAADITGTTKFKDNSIGVLVNSALNESAELNILGTEEIKFTGNGVGVKSSSLGVNNPSVVNVVGVSFENGAVGNNRGIELVNDTRYFIEQNDFSGFNESVRVQSAYSNNPLNNRINCNAISGSTRGINITGDNSDLEVLYNKFSDNNQDVELFRIGAELAEIIASQGEEEDPADNEFTSSNQAIQALATEAVAFTYWYGKDVPPEDEPNDIGQVFMTEETDDPNPDNCTVSGAGGEAQMYLGNSEKAAYSILNEKRDDSYSSKVQIYPNPVVSKLFISVPAEIDNIEHLRITDLHGREVYSNNYVLSNTLQTIDLNNLVSGIYLLELKRLGSESIIERLIKY